MLTLDRAGRLTAASLVEAIRASSSDKEKVNFCCDECL